MYTKIAVVLITINLIMMIRLSYKVWLLSRIDLVDKQIKANRCENRQQRIEFVKLMQKRFMLVRRYEYGILDEWR
jgi:hypothetical protein